PGRHHGRSRPPQVGVPGEDLPGPHVPAPPSTARWTGARAVVRRAGRGRGSGSAWTCGRAAADQAWAAGASELVGQVIAARRPGDVFDGLKVPECVPRVRQSRALWTTDGET